MGVKCRLPIGGAAKGGDVTFVTVNVTQIQGEGELKYNTQRGEMI